MALSIIVDRSLKSPGCIRPHQQENKISHHHASRQTTYFFLSVPYFLSTPIFLSATFSTTFLVGLSLGPFLISVTFGIMVIFLFCLNWFIEFCEKVLDVSYLWDLKWPDRRSLPSRVLERKIARFYGSKCTAWVFTSINLFGNWTSQAWKYTQNEYKNELQKERSMRCFRSLRSYDANRFRKMRAREAWPAASTSTTTRGNDAAKYKYFEHFILLDSNPAKKIMVSKSHRYPPRGPTRQGNECLVD